MNIATAAIVMQVFDTLVSTLKCITEDDSHVFSDATEWQRMHSEAVALLDYHIWKLQGAPGAVWYRGVPIGRVR